MTCGRATEARPWWQKVAAPMGKVAKDVMFVACFLQILLAGLREVVTKCKLRDRRAHVKAPKRAFRARLPSVLTSCNSKNRCFPPSFHKKLKTCYLKIDVSCKASPQFHHISQNVVIACLWLRRVYEGSCKTFRLRRCHSVKFGRTKLDEVSHDMLVLRLPRVSC